MRYADHTKKRHSTFFDAQEQAEAYAAVKRKQLFEEGLNSLSLPDQVRHEASLAHALLQDYGKGILEAAQFFVRHLQENEKNCTLHELVDKFMWDLEGNNVSERHLTNTRQQLAKFSNVFGKRIVSTITDLDIENWMRNSSWGPVTKAGYLRAIKGLFKYACKRKYARVNPASDIRPPKSQDTEIVIYTHQEMAALLKAAHSSLVPFITIGAFAGLRTAELQRLDWSHVHLEEGHIEVKGRVAKTSHRRIVPMSENLKAWLKPFADRTGPLLGGMNESALYDGLNRTAKQAGMTLKPNALRHSFASYREAQIRDVARVASEMGNSPSMVHKHYRAVVTPKEAEVFWGILPSLELAKAA